LRGHLREIAIGSFETVQNAIKDPKNKQSILKDSFKSALAGISSGVMKYE
jgi:hypothetical protein